MNISKLVLTSILTILLNTTATSQTTEVDCSKPLSYVHSIARQDKPKQDWLKPEEIDLLGNEIRDMHVRTVHYFYGAKNKDPDVLTAHWYLSCLKAKGDPTKILAGKNV